MVSRFKRIESTMRSRNCPSLSRAPTPASGDARLPMKRPPGHGVAQKAVAVAPRKHLAAALGIAGLDRERRDDIITSHAVGRERSGRRHNAARRHAVHREPGQPAHAPPDLDDQTVMPWFLSGSERMRLPVAAKIAFTSAGASGASGVSPVPPQKPPLGTSTASTFGISRMRIIG